MKQTTDLPVFPGKNSSAAYLSSYQHKVRATAVWPLALNDAAPGYWSVLGTPARSVQWGTGLDWEKARPPAGRPVRQMHREVGARDGERGFSCVGRMMGWYLGASGGGRSRNQTSCKAPGWDTGTHLAHPPPSQPPAAFPARNSHQHEAEFS